jgi:putative chitinase
MVHTIMTAAILKAYAPNADPKIAATIIGGADQLEAAGIDTPLRLAHFLAQVATETRGLAAVEESLNYSVEGLRATFGRHRISDDDCARFGRTATRRAHQNAIANIVYGGEWGRQNLGNTERGDGWRFRGGGMLQTTGRRNYRKAGHEHDPETLRTPEGAFRSALHEWTTRGCSVLADRDDITSLRIAINGGTNGLDHCREHLARAKVMLVV